MQRDVPKTALGCKGILLQGCSCLCIVIPDKGAQRALIRYPAPLSKGAAFCRYIFLNKEQNASRFGICAGFRLGARYRSLGRNDGESLGFGRNEQPWILLFLGGGKGGVGWVSLGGL
jgi:hypothetical protein